MKRAKLLCAGMHQWRGDSRLYMLADDMEYQTGKTRYIVVSPGEKHELLIFATDLDSNCLDWTPLHACEGLNHDQALRAIGYVPHVSG